ncbi:hypothetical protein GCM10020369_08020 [Cryptosporangium minutisporangium]|uniref:Uncharacterized protein n=1 Tax=Cryptosporangium minutisporangium TaxID=113569 RepID=A0ABP6SSB1_9ACTN
MRTEPGRPRGLNRGGRVDSERPPTCSGGRPSNFLPDQALQLVVEVVLLVVLVVADEEQDARIASEASA